MSLCCSYRASFTGSLRNEIVIKPALIRVVAEETQLYSTHNFPPLFLKMFCCDVFSFNIYDHLDNMQTIKTKFFVMHYPEVPTSSVPAENIYLGHVAPNTMYGLLFTYSTSPQNIINMRNVCAFFFEFMVVLHEILHLGP
jgi:hypothetical protein